MSSKHTTNTTFQVRAFQYWQALMKLYSSKNKFRSRTGRRLLSLDIIEQRYNICKECEHFNGVRCQLCGCCSGQQETHFNKLAFPTEECPDGKWDKWG